MCTSCDPGVLGVLAVPGTLSCQVSVDGQGDEEDESLIMRRTARATVEVPCWPARGTKLLIERMHFRVSVTLRYSPTSGQPAPVSC